MTGDWESRGQANPKLPWKYPWKWFVCVRVNFGFGKEHKYFSFCLLLDRQFWCFF